MTRIYSTTTELRKRDTTHILVGAALGVAFFALAFAGFNYYLAEAGRAAETIDPRLEQSCVWPRVEGEMTVVAVLNGNLICWRWR